MNIVILIGNIASEIKLNESETMASFRLAVSKDTAEGGADFINCKAFNKTAVNLHRFKEKGDEIAVMGRISTGSYTNREGKTVYTTDVICNRIDYTRGSKSDKQEAKRDDGYTHPQVRQLVDNELPDSFAQAEDDIPF